MSSSPLLSLKNVSISLEGRSILSSISLSLQEGQLTTLIGPNGAGKSTLLKVILALIPPSEGEIWTRKKIKMGYMPQKLNLDPLLPLSVARFLKLGKTLSPRKLKDILKEVGASSLEKRSIHTLSGGEFQRVLLARSLLQKPDLLILDEPVQGVDIVGQMELYQLIDQIRKKRKCTVLLVSHDLHLVMRTSDQVICLHGHVCCAGHPDSVQKHPTYQALFGGPPILAPYTHHHDHRHDQDSASGCGSISAGSKEENHA